VVEQIVLNEDFPRSVVYSVSQLHRYFQRLQSDSNVEAYRKIDFQIGKIKSRIKYSTVDTIMEQGLHVYLRGIKEDLYAIGNAFNQYYFAYS